MPFDRETTNLSVDGLWSKVPWLALELRIGKSRFEPVNRLAVFEHRDTSAR
jgi:hypothetical protein